ncbi:MAG: flippase-like domain-containing protein [Candidatus Kerfeldbacteria bacterium]|nr:flippase-like domain-containing protein [Candidatus Kerfeldbacteria bacterium]
MTGKRWIREFLRWGIVVLVFVFLWRRVAADWPTVGTVVSRISWPWLVGSFIPGLTYFWLRAVTWHRLLGSLGVQTNRLTAWNIWMKAEVVRYIPGYVWSVLGRMAQAGRVGTSRTNIFASMALEAMLLVSSCAGLAAVLLIGYPQHQWPGRTAVLVAVALASLVMTLRPVSSGLVHLLQRLLRRPTTPIVGSHAPAFVLMTLSWLMFAVFQLFVAQALGVVMAASLVTLAGVFLLSWLLGYLSFVAPSGLGVREAFLLSLLAPLMSVPEAVAVAAVSRVSMIVVEVLVLGLVHVLARRSARDAQPSSQDLAAPNT